MLIHVITNMSALSFDIFSIPKEQEICPSVLQSFGAAALEGRSQNIDGPGNSLRGKSLIVLRREQQLLDGSSYDWLRWMADISTVI